MNGRELHELAEARAQELPGATLSNPFGPGSDVYKVRGKMFALLTATGGVPIVNLKITPEDGAALREQHSDIRPAWHMNKKHWISVHPGGSVDAELLADLVTESYLLVVEKLPRAHRPVDPAAFGRVER
ncbi:MmcQ/YjbR family DNA-binding protein [Rarobacter faecitabidus]|uniref:Putative DNA-binding protein (MmcQ/YjbR family) n=1 Tax=Rarobacter faecitabidus TaxID=13243 RepID=A0A542ZVB2_RARFA|nr:MmcQ/YjbR family DNA-binding protein [Rarobacter faecitabidus]TQL64120.1 putative DNA-binding protein (MmcQ/YjbR family) [Rarobacter faecitabidus]